MAEEAAPLDTDTPSYYSPAVSSVPLDRLVKDAVPDYGVDTDRLKSDLTDVARRKAAATEAASNRQFQAMEQGRGEVGAKYAGISPVDVKPWNADKEKAERVQSPLEAFGSMAGIFAMIASAFTKTPMDNALNAGAAAINSVRANDFDGYNKAHEAWTENTNLALKRHETERQSFKDALELFNNDPVAGGAELKAVSARFGAQAELAAINAGYVDKVFEIQQAKSQAAQKLITTMPQLAKMDETIRATMMGQKAVQEENQRRTQAGLPPMSTTEEAAMIGGVKQRLQQNMGTFSNSKMEAVAIRDRADELVKEAQANGTEMSTSDAYAQAAREVASKKSALTANQADKLKGHVDQIDESIKSIENIEKTIEKYVGAAGVPGRVLRVNERVSNILGSNETDRVQMLRDLERVRMNATRILTDANARPLASEATRINTIIPGNELGDTGANTLRALEEIKALYGRMKKTTLSRIDGSWKPEGGNAPAGAPAATGGAARGNPWDNDPIVNK